MEIDIHRMFDPNELLDAVLEGLRGLRMKRLIKSNAKRCEILHLSFNVTETVVYHSLYISIHPSTGL